MDSLHNSGSFPLQDIATVHFRAEENEDLGTSGFRNGFDEPGAFDVFGPVIIDRPTIVDCF